MARLVAVKSMVASPLLASADAVRVEPLRTALARLASLKSIMASPLLALAVAVVFEPLMSTFSRLAPLKSMPPYPPPSTESVELLRSALVRSASLKPMVASPSPL